MRLPKIDENAVAKVLREMSVGDLPGDISLKLEDENPEFEKAIVLLAESGNYINVHSIIVGAMLAYRLLELQE